MPLPEDPREVIFPDKSEKTDIVNYKDGVYEFWWNRNNVSKGGSTPDPCDDRWILRRPRPKPISF